MGDIRFLGNELEMLVDRHIELCELSESRRVGLSAAPPLLFTMNHGKATVECLADLADSALAAYEGRSPTQDPAFFALKIALTEAIMDLT
jgi:hypothetical protein